MKYTLLILVAGSLLLANCGEKKSGGGNSAGSDSSKYFQVRQYIESQIKEVNATPYYIYQLEVLGDKKDSTGIDVNHFNKLAQNFLVDDINSPELKSNYKENIFHDETTKSFTVSYTSNNDKLPVRSIDVLLEEDGKTIKRVFMRKFFNYGDSSAIEQLGWKPSQSFQINRLVTRRDNSEQATQTTVVWNPKQND